MGFVSIILIAITEAMDCFAVSLSTGLCKSKIKYNKALLQSFSFGFFQGLMTVLGYFLGKFAEQCFSIGTPIACGILCILGLRMIWETIHEKEFNENKSCKLSLASILLLSLATSIDAFAIGISFAFMKVDLFFATLAIAIASFVIAQIGFEIGKRTAKHFNTKIPGIIAGIILVAIGIKILF